MLPDWVIRVVQDPKGEERCVPTLDRRQWMPGHGGRLCWVSLRTGERFRGSVGRGGCGGRSLSGMETLGMRELLEAG